MCLREEADGIRAESVDLRETLKSERSEVYKLRDVAKELRSLLDSRTENLNHLQMRTEQVENSFHSIPS